MNTQEEIIEYIEKGLKQGFNIDYIKETLVQYGHKENKITEAIKIVRDIKHTPKVAKHLEILKKDKKIPSIGIYITITAILVIIIVILGSMTMSNNFSEKKLETSLGEVDKLSIIIDANQDIIDQKINDIKQLDSSIDDKEELVEKQLEDISKLNEYIKEERSKTRDLLLELMAFILNK